MRLGLAVRATLVLMRNAVFVAREDATVWALVRAWVGAVRTRRADARAGLSWALLPTSPVLLLVSSPRNACVSRLRLLGSGSVWAVLTRISLDDGRSRTAQ